MALWPFAKRRKSTLSATQIKKVDEEPSSEYHYDIKDVQIPDTQCALLLHAIRQPYQLTADYAIPKAQHDHELLVKIEAAGLNPIDWKSP